jgi:hypothetical protein
MPVRRAAEQTFRVNQGGVLVGKPGDPGGTTVTTRDTGCQSTTVHKENEMGDSKTVKRTDC